MANETKMTPGGIAFGPATPNLDRTVRLLGTKETAEEFAALRAEIASLREERDRAMEALRLLCDAVGDEDMERAEAGCDCTTTATHERASAALFCARALLPPPATETEPSASPSPPPPQPPNDDKE